MLKSKSDYCLTLKKLDGDEPGEGEVIPLNMVRCVTDIYDPSMMFELNMVGWIAVGYQCMEPNVELGRVELKPCSEGNQRQIWRMSGDRIVHVASNAKCLAQESIGSESNMDEKHFGLLKDCSAKVSNRMEKSLHWEFINF